MKLLLEYERFASFKLYPLKTDSADDKSLFFFFFPKKIGFDIPCKLSLMYAITRVLQKVLSLGSDYFSATFYQTYFYYKPSKYSPFTETHFCNLFTQSRKADK